MNTKNIGGVVPEIASRMHVEAISVVVKKALEEANITMDKISAVAVTKGPGLVGALLVGVSYAKGLRICPQQKSGSCKSFRRTYSGKLH